MRKKYPHNLSSYLELPPLIIGHSLLMHVIVLSFLLTLPIYSNVNEKGSLWGHHVYLTVEKTDKAQAATVRNLSEKEIEAAKNMETAITPGKIIDDVKNKEEAAPPAGPDKETGSNDIKRENITGEGPSEVKQDENYTDGRLTDIKSVYPEANKEAEIIVKETDKIEKAEAAAPVSAAEHGARSERPAAPHIQPKAISPGLDQSRNNNVEKISDGEGRKNFESPFADLQPLPKNDASVSYMMFPAGGIELSGKGLSSAKEEAETIAKGESKAEQPAAVAQSVSGNKTVQDNKNALYAAEDNEKAGTGKAADTQEAKQSLKAAARKLAVNPGIKKTAKAASSSPVKTGKTVSDRKTGMTADAPKTSINAGSSKTTALAVMPAQNHVREDSAYMGLSIKREKMPSLLSDIDDIIKKALLELQPVYEKIPGPYKEDRGEKGAEAEEERSVLGLPMDESFFNKDIKIEVLRQNAGSHGVYMYLLKNSYLSLRKRHSWDKENRIETIVETKRINGAESEMKTVFLVAKSDEGIYSFVIENTNAVPYNAEVVIVLYGGQKRERTRKISVVSVPPSSMLRFMFVLPDTVFWDDEEFFTGSIEDSDSITKFNDERGFVWKEGKDH